MEVFQLVTADGVPMGSAPRDRCHGDPRLIHLVVHLHVLDADGRLLLQKRSAAKDTNPGRWDTSVGGHVHHGEPVSAALAREAKEELGVDAAGARFLYGYLHRGVFESEYAQCFALSWSGSVRPEPGEIDEVRYFRFEEVDALLGSGTLTPLFEQEWPRFKRAIIEAKR
jgi:isopentenyldiphosphate isomerase